MKCKSYQGAEIIEVNALELQKCKNFKVMLRALSWKRKGAEILAPLHIFRIKFFFFGRFKKKNSNMSIGQDIKEKTSYQQTCYRCKEYKHNDKSDEYKHTE